MSIDYNPYKRMYARIIGIPAEQVANTIDQNLDQLIWDNRELAEQWVTQNTEQTFQQIETKYTVYADETLDEAASRYTFLTGQLVTPQTILSEVAR